MLYHINQVKDNILTLLPSPMGKGRKHSMKVKEIIQKVTQEEFIEIYDSSIQTFFLECVNLLTKILLSYIKK